MVQDSDERVVKYNHAVNLFKEGKFYDAYQEFKSLGQFMDAYTYMMRCKEALQEYYDEAKYLFNEAKYAEALELFKTIKDYLDAVSMANRCNDKLLEIRRREEAERRAEEERIEREARLAREAEEARERARLEEEARIRREAEARERAAREREAERRRAIEDRERRIRERRERNAGLFESIIQFVVILIPAILLIVFAIILFSNKTQIEITSNYTGWVTGWVFYLFLCVPFTIVALVKRCHRSHDDTTSRIFAALMAGISLLASLIGFINASKLQSNFNPARDFVITFRYKKNTGTSYSYYDSEMGFGMINTTKLKITYIEWEAMMYNGAERVGWYTIWHDGLLPPNQTTNTYISLSESKSGIYNTSYENMTISYKILKLQFNNNYTTYTFDNSFRYMKKA